MSDHSASSAARRARVRARWSPPPGPLPRGDRGDPSLRPAADETLDALSGEWRIFQRRDGHRYSTDDLLTAWYGARVTLGRGLAVRTALDLGSGIGSVAMILAWKLPQARLVAIEAQAISASLFARSIRYNGIEERVELRLGDLREPSILAPTERFDLVTGSPPYLPIGSGVSSARPQCDPCRFERRGGVEDYARVAAGALAPEGRFVLVHEMRAADRVLAAIESAGLRPRSLRPVVFRAGKAPHLALFSASRSNPVGPLREEPLLCIRDESGRRSASYRAARQWMGFPP